MSEHEPIKFEGDEEADLWMTTAIAVLEKFAAAPTPQAAVELSAAYADELLLEFRKRV